MEQNNLQRELERIRAVHDVIDLIDTNFQRNGFRFPHSIIRDAMSRYLEEYLYEPDPRGAETARAAISRYYRNAGLEIDQENILITASSSESYSLLFNHFTQPGDNIVLPRPGYPLFEYLAEFSHLQTRFYDLDPTSNFRIDHDSLEHQVDDRTRFIIIISPNNPTGRIAGPDELESVLETCRRRDVRLVVDEVFSEFRYDSVLPRPAELEARRGNRVSIFTLNGISKMFASPDLKLGWIAASGPQKELVVNMERLELANDMFLNANSFSQFLLPELFRSGAEFQREMVSRIDENRRLLCRTLSGRSDIAFVEPNGGIHTTAGLLTRGDDESFAVELLRSEHIYVHPGYLYGIETGTWFVLSFLKRPELFAEGLRRLSHFLDASALSRPADNSGSEVAGNRTYRERDGSET